MQSSNSLKVQQPLSSRRESPTRLCQKKVSPSNSEPALHSLTHLAVTPPQQSLQQTTSEITLTQLTRVTTTPLSDRKNSEPTYQSRLKRSLSISPELCSNTNSTPPITQAPSSVLIPKRVSAKINQKRISPRFSSFSPKQLIDLSIQQLISTAAMEALSSTTQSSPKRSAAIISPSLGQSQNHLYLDLNSTNSIYT